MKLLSFTQFLNEMPLPIGTDPKSLDPKPGKYTFAGTGKIFKELGTQIGKGSSRIAFKVEVEASQFNPNILKKYGLPASGKVTTVFKLAINSKGVTQNASEIQHHKNVGDNPFLLPILDTSQWNKGITFDNEELSNWIQMPLAPPPSQKQFKQFWYKMFGNTLDYVKYAHDIQILRNLDNKGVFDTEEQMERFEDFLNLCEELGLGIADLVRPANWGVWNNKMYVIDYGFDSNTSSLYSWGAAAQTAHAYVDSNGNLSLEYRKKQSPSLNW